MPSCLPLGLQERRGDHSRHGHCPCVCLSCCGISRRHPAADAVSLPGAEEPLRNSLGLLGSRCDLVPSVVGQVLWWQHVGAGEMWLWDTGKLPGRDPAPSSELQLATARLPPVMLL